MANKSKQRTLSAQLAHEAAIRENAAKLRKRSASEQLADEANIRKKHSAEIKQRRLARAPPDDAVYITRGQVCARYGGRSRMWLERVLATDPTFPRPIFIRKVRYWRFADIIAWERKAAAGRAA